MNLVSLKKQDSFFDVAMEIKSHKVWLWRQLLVPNTQVQHMAEYQHLSITNHFINNFNCRNKKMKPNR